MQIVMVSLMTSGVPLLMIAMMTFFINARHIFYGIGFVAKFRKMGWKYPYMVLTLTDETYSVFCSIQYPEDIDEQKADFYIALICHLLWIFSCTMGALIGETLPFDMTGIEFSATAFLLRSVSINGINSIPTFLQLRVLLVLLFFIFYWARLLFAPSIVGEFNCTDHYEGSYRSENGE